MAHAHTDVKLLHSCSPRGSRWATLCDSPAYAADRAGVGFCPRGETDPLNVVYVTVAVLVSGVVMDARRGGAVTSVCRRWGAVWWCWGGAELCLKQGHVGLN